MMNRLWVRLTFTFVAITLLSVALVALLANNAAADQFQSLPVEPRDDEPGQPRGRPGCLLPAERQLGPCRSRHKCFGDRHDGPGARFWARGPAVTLADASGTVISGDGAGSALSSGDRAVALPIDVQGKTVGYLLVSTPGRVVLNQAQQAFLDSCAAT